MKKIVLLFATGLLFLTVEAQSGKEKKSIVFSSINSVNYFSGTTDMQLGLSTTNGIRYKSWFTGVGLSFDPYGHKGDAIYLEVSKSIGKNVWQPFVNIDAGIFIPKRTSDLPEKKSNGDDYYLLKNTFYGAIAIGINKTILGNNKLFIKLGVIYKQFSYVQKGYTTQWYIYPDYVYNYKYTPYNFSIGFQL